MRNVTTRSVLISFAVLFSWQPLAAQSGSQRVEDANRLYAEEKYDEANTKYRDALIEHPDSPIINFNIGDVEYKKRNLGGALESYSKSLGSEDILLQSKAYYNMGNTLYHMGKLPESIIHYKKALELNPNDEDAKYNLEYVRAKLKDNSQQQNQNQDNQNQEQQEQQEQQEPQQQQQQQNQNQEQNEQDQQQQDQQQEEQQGEENEQQQEEQQGEQQQDQESGEQQDQQEQNQDEQSDQQQAEQEQAGEQKEISKEDAERILDALQNEEQDLLKQQKTKKARGAFRGKDW